VRLHFPLIFYLTQVVSSRLDETLTEVTSTSPLNYTAKPRHMSRITSSSERGGYFSSSMSFYVNCAGVEQNSDLFLFCFFSCSPSVHRYWPTRLLDIAESLKSNGQSKTARSLCLRLRNNGKSEARNARSPLNAYARWPLLWDRVRSVSRRSTMGKMEIEGLVMEKVL